MAEEKSKRKTKLKNEEQSHLISIFVFMLGIGICVGLIILMFNQVEPSSTSSRSFVERNVLLSTSFGDNPFAEDSIWTVEERRTDLEVAWTDTLHDGNFTLQLSASQGANQGWPGLTTTIQAVKGYDYVFSVNAFSPDGASPWLSVDLLDADGSLIRDYSTGCAEAQSVWHKKSYRLGAKAHEDVAASAIRFGLLQCLNYSEGTRTTLYYDDVHLVSELPNNN